MANFTSQEEIPLLNGIATLEKYISRRSMFESVVRDSPATCHPGTRQRTLTTILSWINKRSPHENVLWLNGAEGVGKSAIMQNIAEIMARTHRERYAGDYFISSNFGYGRQENQTLIPTLAYQIAQNLPGMRDLIDSAMADKPTLPMESMEAQMEHLITMPLRRSLVDFSRHTPVVLIDGLDQCQDPDTLKRIISIISDSISFSEVPLRFLVASCAEDLIKDAFSCDPLFLATKEIRLDDSDSRPEANTDADIERYYIAEFDEIYEKNPKMWRSVPRPWPSLDAMRLLIFEASGNFLYASTVVRYIAQDFKGPENPDRALNSIISMINAVHSTDTIPSSSALDRLYMAILSVYQRLEPLKAVLAGILLRFRPIVIEGLLGVDRAEIDTALKHLKPIIELQSRGYELDEDDVMTRIFGLLDPDSDPPKMDIAITHGHRSFRDFLLDQGRSGSFFIDLECVRETISARFFDKIDDQGQTTSERWKKERAFVYDAVYTLTDTGDNDVLPTLLPLFSKPSSFLLQILGSGQINFLVPETASLLILLYCLESHIIEDLRNGRDSEFPEEILATMRQNPYPTVVQSLFSSKDLETVVDHLKGLIEEYICQRSKGRRHIRMKKEPIRFESHQVHYKEFGNMSQPKLLFDEGPSNTRPMPMATDPTLLWVPSATRGDLQSGKGKPVPRQSGRTPYSPSVPRSSLMAPSSSGLGGRSVYSHASSRTETTDYGIFYTRRDISGDNQYR